MHAVIDKATVTEYVVMTREEAERVAQALDVAVMNLRWIANHTPRMPGRRSAMEAADTLDVLNATHKTAHGLDESPKRAN